MNVYIRWVNEAFQKYVSARQRYCTLEARWPGSPFWQRRLSSPIFANRAQPYRTHQPNSSPSDFRHHSE